MEEPDDQAANISKGSQECFEIVCDPCSGHDIVKADGYCVECKEFMCAQCFQSHKGMKMSRNHHIQGPEEMPKAKPSDDPEQETPPPKDELKTECNLHEGEVIKYYCKNHKEVGCMDCITFNHRSCAEIKRVAEASSDESVATELEDFDRRLKTVDEELRNMLQDAETNHLQVQDQKETLLQTIRQYKESFIESLDNLANMIETKLNETMKEEHTKIDQLIDRCKAVQKDVEETSIKHDSFKQSNRKTSDFILMNQSQLQLAIWEKNLNEMATIAKINKYAFCPDLNLRRVTKNVSEFGQLVLETDTEQCSVCKNMTVKSHFHKLICGHCNCDVFATEIDGSCRTCATCGKVTVRCDKCKMDFNENDTETLVCGHQPACRGCSSKRDSETCSACGVTTVRCYTCKKDFNENDTETLVCGHQPACRGCSSKRDSETCLTCGVTTVHCKRCKIMKDKSNISTLACGHEVCLSCRKQQTEKETPCADCGLITGNQPSGSLQERTEEELGCKIQVLEVVFPDGRQEPMHPRPGQSYKGDKLICRLNTGSRGHQVCKMLKTAFERKLICKIENDKVVPNIELFKGQVFDWIVIFTDEYISYISRVERRLKELGITT